MTQVKYQKEKWTDYMSCMPISSACCILACEFCCHSWGCCTCIWVCNGSSCCWTRLLSLHLCQHVLAHAPPTTHHYLDPPQSQYHLNCPWAIHMQFSHSHGHRLGMGIEWERSEWPDSCLSWEALMQFFCFSPISGWDLTMFQSLTMSSWLQCNAQ